MRWLGVLALLGACTPSVTIDCKSCVPDLLLQNVEVLPSPVLAYGPLTVRASVVNGGEAAVPLTEVALSFDGEEVASAQVGPLAPQRGEPIELSVARLSRPGAIALRLEVDPRQAVAESSEENNVHERWVDAYCALTTCAAQGKNCGLVPDGCGGVLPCGTCTAPATCGGGGVANVCGSGSCTPSTCARLGKDCGQVSDGCGGVLSCGTCMAPATCGGGGVANVCGSGCVPKTCAELGKDCDAVPNGCGGMLACGSCVSPKTCGGGGVANVCAVPGALGVSFTAPAPQARIDGPQTVRLTVSGTPTRVELWVNGVQRGTKGSAPWEFSWDASEEVGAQALEARAFDASGGAATATLAVTVGLTVRVLNLVFDPIIEAQGGQKLRTLKGWNDPAVLTQLYLQELELASGGFVKYQVVDTIVVDGKTPGVPEYPPQRNGFVYDDNTFMACVNSNYQTCAGNGTNYLGVISQFNLVARVDGTSAGPQIDEVLMWGAPGMGFWESMMAGPGAYWINGTPEPSVPSQRVFAMMGLNYERYIAEALESYAHRMESTMVRVYGSNWQQNQANAWNCFTSLHRHQTNLGGIGNAHNAVNAEPSTDYNRSSLQLVPSTADNWYSYPTSCVCGASCPRVQVNRNTWFNKFTRTHPTAGSADYARSYLVWFYDHLPRYRGRGPDGRLNNWWRYFALHDRYKSGY